MKLNADYVRDILLFIEKYLDYEDSESQVPHIHKEITDGQLISNEYFTTYNKQELSYALEQLIKAGLIDLASKPNVHNGNINMARIIGLTWSGHELLDNVRDNTIWNTVKQRASKFTGVSIAALFNGAKFLTNALMSDPNAIQNFNQGIENIGKMFGGS